MSTLQDEAMEAAARVIGARLESNTYPNLLTRRMTECTHYSYRKALFVTVSLSCRGSPDTSRYKQPIAGVNRTHRKKILHR